MVAAAGSKGGAVGHVSGADQQFVYKLLAGRVNKSELIEYTRSRSRPSLGLVVNNACNLACRHCYLQVGKVMAPALKLEEWKEFADSIAGSHAALVSICGKETLLGDTGIELLEYLENQRAERGGRFKLGLISNGTLMKPYRDKLSEIDPDFLDISFEGMPEQHDAVRGVGSYARAAPNMEWASDRFRDRFFVALTVQKRNYLGLIQTAQHFRSRGVRNVFLTFYEPMPYSDQTLSLTARDKSVALDSLTGLQELPSGPKLNVYVDVELFSREPIEVFFGSRWFDASRIQLDESGMCFVEHVLANGISLRFRFSPYPLGIWHTARVTVEGLYLASEDTLDTTRYAERAIANVRDFDYDFQELHRYAMNSPQFHDIIDNYYDAVLPVLSRLYNAHLRDRKAA